VGDVVTIAGQTAPGPRLPFVLATAIATEGRADLPFAAEITFAQGIGGREEHQWVRLRGRLLRNESFEHWQRLSVGAPEGEFSVSIRDDERLDVPLGTSLLIRGVCNLWTPPDSGEIRGLFLYTPSTADVRTADEAAPANTALTRCDDVRRLSAADADAGLPVRLRGVVTFAHPEQRLFYLNDDTGGMLIRLERESDTLPSVGTAVSVQGITCSGTPLSGVRATRIETEGTLPLPAPRPISIGRALTGAEDAQWVEMRGRLRQVDAIGGWLRLYLTTAAGEITVSIPQPSAPEAKVGSFLSVRGVCQSWNNEYNRIGGFFLYSPSTAELAVLEPAPADPFAVPEESIANLARYRPETLDMQQVRMSGTVLLHHPGHYVVIQNATGTVRAYAHAGQSLQPGDRIEIAGVPGRQGNRSVLRGAVFRRIATGQPPQPVVLPPAPKADTTLDGRLVSLTGRLTNVTSRPSGTRILLEAGDMPVRVGHPVALPAAAALRPGSNVAIVGLYDLEYSEDDEPSAFSIQLRSPEDIVLLASPPWWTVSRALYLLGAIGACLCLGMAWVAILRRQVRRQTTIIRQQLETEAALSERQREIVENASDAIFSTDLAGRLTSLNPAGERMTGYTATEALGLALADLVAPEDGATVATFLAQSKLTSHSPAAHFETHFRTKDNQPFWVEISARPIFEENRVTGLLGIARDIASRKQMEELNRQVQKADSLHRMAAAIAHNFNNQLQAVLIGFEMIKLELPKNTSMAEIVAAAERSARQAAEIGTLMLTYLGQAPGKREALDLAAACRSGLARLREKLTCQASLETDFPTTGLEIYANPTQIQQVLASLLTNAVEAIGDTPGTIRVSAGIVQPGAVLQGYRRPLRFRPKDRTYACLTVADTGCGIAEADFGKLFDPFYTTKFTGRGMGLAAVLGIVRAHDGAVFVKSTPGQGTTFRVLLPMRKPDNDVPRM
jgi:PAS domain S-box-containing protein